MPAPKTRRLILASESPRRRALLEGAGFEFAVEPARVEEHIAPGEDPARAARRLALEKAKGVAGRGAAGACVLAADTVVVLDDRVLGKPRDAAEARAMLRALGGRTHRVLTGFALVCRQDGLCEAGVEESRVRMRRLGPLEIERYVASGEPLDKAGSYGLQGEGGRFVEAVEGSRTNVIGLPLEAVVPALERMGVARP